MEIKPQPGCLQCSAITIELSEPVHFNGQINNEIWHVIREVIVIECVILVIVIPLTFVGDDISANRYITRFCVIEINCECTIWGKTLHSPT